MDGTFVEAVQEALTSPQFMGETIVVPPGWTELRPAQPVVTSLIAHTLGAVVGYVAAWAKRDFSEEHGVLVHVVTPTMVHVLGPLGTLADNYVRPVYFKAEATPCDMQFGAWLGVEDAIISLLSKFESTEDRNHLLAVLSHITENQVRTLADDGLTQEVTTRAGLTMTSRSSLPSPVILAPYRTFREVAQPTSPFVLRARAAPTGDRPQILLVEADSGTWKVQAVKHVCEYLSAHLEDVERAVVIG